MFHYHGTKVFAARYADYKLYFYKNNPRGYPQRLAELEAPELFNIRQDSSERFNIAEEHPEMIEDIQQKVEKHLAMVERPESELDKFPRKINQ